MTNSLKDKLLELPTAPGVYFHKDQKGKIIYVGKAANLRNRVRQYFQASRARDTKTELLVADIYDLDWVTVDSEIEALFLEAEMIKRYMPKYNIDLRDDKQYQYVRIDIKSQHPTVNIVRRPLDDGAEYFGPYIRGARQALKVLRKIFPFDYKIPVATKKRANLHYHLGMSPGLEAGKMTLDEYRSNLRKLMSYLRGKRVDVEKQLEKEMKTASRAKQYEVAAIKRNQLIAMRNLKSTIVFGDKEMFDISKDQALSGLQELLGLKSPPRRIEGYDISHQSGTNNVASMVVFTNGISDKHQYRKFKMKTPGNNDFAHMHEVISRRFSGRHLTWPKPDLLLIDGGKGQLRSAQQALAEKEVAIPSIGLAKRYEEIVVLKDGEFEVINLPKDSHVIKLLQRIRDESHRFAVSYHSVLKRRAQTVSWLDSVPGIGPATRKKLIKTFGSLRGVRQARAEELAATIGNRKASVLRQYLGELKRVEKREQADATS